ncbi:hypothetical protein EDEG_01571 [Edhazardia aedis USNM 41457]|uniref:Uncharacterized protein n=1 Tax=Edhazardia aedis (strain USNM 41457) TaxID=1003232 RepID=J9DNM5_EDHAE|nr:hypothetical protein EDEG_01571 [Edhazardia aedis USNM 41457]|eukprot:EJW04135.1 hypothetical protein EDEG_01571 [Edhazardia aedis USNM 41457]
MTLVEQKTKDSSSFFSERELLTVSIIFIVALIFCGIYLLLRYIYGKSANKYVPKYKILIDESPTQLNEKIDYVVKNISLQNDIKADKIKIDGDNKVSPSFKTSAHTEMLVGLKTKLWYCFLKDLSENIKGIDAFGSEKGNVHLAHTLFLHITSLNSTIKRCLLGYNNMISIRENLNVCGSVVDIVENTFNAMIQKKKLSDNAKKDLFSFISKIRDDFKKFSERKQEFLDIKNAGSREESDCIIRAHILLEEIMSDFLESYFQAQAIFM